MSWCVRSVLASSVSDITSDAETYASLTLDPGNTYVPVGGIQSSTESCCIPRPRGVYREGMSRSMSSACYLIMFRAGQELAVFGSVAKCP